MSTESKYKFNSEALDYAAQHIIGVAGMKVEEALERYQNSDDEMDWYGLANQVQHLWCTMEALLKLSSCTTEATYFNIAVQNEYRRVSEYIKSVCGVSPTQEKERFKFRGNFKFDKEESK